MPWISQDMCTGCGVCVNECPVDAIELEASGLAKIDEGVCIRCGKCHDVCPQEAVRHDGERVPQEVADNLRWVQSLLGHYNEPQERSAFTQRMIRFFRKQKKVSEQTLTALTAVNQEDPTKDIEAAIGKLSRPSSGESGGS